MMFKDTTTRYGLLSMANHWVSAGLMGIVMVLGWIMEDIGDKANEVQLTKLHMSLGCVVLIFSLIRIGWRKTNPTPNAPIAMEVWQKKAAKLIKIGLYIILVALPMTGWILSNADGHAVSVFGFFDLPKLVSKNHNLEEIMEEIHELFVNAFLLIVSIHVFASLKHHYFDKDNVLKNMLPEK